MNSPSVDLPPIPLIQRQLETTLQLLISLSSTMTTDDILMVRIRLTEADIIMGSILVERDNNAGNGNSTPTPLLPFT